MQFLFGFFWLKGMFKLFAPPDSSFRISSQSFCPHQSAYAIFFSLITWRNSSFVSMFCTDSLMRLSAIWKRFSWISSSFCSRSSLIFSRGMGSFVPVSLLTTSADFFSRSLGPSSMRMGTPFISHWLYFHPGRLSVSSIWMRIPLSCFFRFSAAVSISFLFSSLCIGMMTAWMGAIFGGMMSPLLSPCIPIIIPMLRVVIPQLFCHAGFSCSSLSMNLTLNAFAKWSPRLWLVATWIAFPFGKKVSMLVVVSAPANFSFSDFVPLKTGIARRLWQISS